MAHPTKYPALNRVLAELVEGAQAALAENFCGAYLQGSFALGNADARSDVDFLIATEKETTNDQVVGLQALHTRIYGLDDRWAQHLEGSYAARSILRRVNRPRSPFLYLDNGASELIWDNHCNTAVVRWKLRECGVVLAGPDPKRLVEPVTAAELRDEMREAMREYAEWAPEPTVVGGMSRWKQPYLVLTFAAYCTPWRPERLRRRPKPATGRCAISIPNGQTSFSELLATDLARGFASTSLLTSRQPSTRSRSLTTHEA
jgi:hypothetical protein